MARRGNNEGTIVKRADGRWTASITIGWDGDRQKRQWFYGRTRAEVAAKLDAALAARHDGTYIEPKTTTIGQWLDIWLRDYVQPSARETTWTNYEYVIRCHLRPVLGDIPLAKLQTAQVQRMLNERSASDYAPRTVELIQVVLHAALQQAVTEGLLLRNAAGGTKRPKKGRATQRVLTPTDMQALLSVTGTERLGPMIAVMLATGIRLGEALALRWQDVDLPAGVIRIARSASRVKAADGPTKTRVVIREPKTDKGRRSIPFPANLRATLQQWRIRQAEERLALGPAWVDQGLVFTGTTGTMVSQRTLCATLNRLCDRAGVPHINVHGLRHTYATRLLESGIDPRTAQELLGHSTVVMTLDTYSHVLPERKAAAAAAIDALFAPVGRG